MLIVRAQHMGQCFGVKDALELARGVDRPRQTSIYGELVHNPQIQEELKGLGFEQHAEAERGESSLREQVLITAHGVSDRVRDRLRASGKSVIDTTCPLVRRVHKAALHYQKRGYFLVVLGRAGHVEVEGLVGDLERHVVVERLSEVKRWSEERIAVVNQTTMPPAQVEEFHRVILSRNPDSEIELIDTVCRPTRERQAAIEEVLARVQALVVVGGENSNNTRQLGLRAEERGLPWVHVQGPGDLTTDWFRDFRLVGLTAGTSTPDEVIDAVYRRMQEIGRQLERGGLRTSGFPEERTFVRNGVPTSSQKIGA